MHEVLKSYFVYVCSHPLPSPASAQVKRGYNRLDPFFGGKYDRDLSLRGPVPFVASLPSSSNFDGVVTIGLLRRPGSDRTERVLMPHGKKRWPPAGPSKAFSLIELLAVMAIMALMLALLAPAVSSMTSTAGRKGALNILMNTFEQARAAALESGTNVYVVLWQRKFPENDSIIVMRDAVEWKEEEQQKYDAGDRIQLTRYIQMPKNVLLYGGKGKNVFVQPSANTGSSELDQLAAQLPKVGGVAPKKSEIGYIKFSPIGTIQYPDKDHSRVIISEGVRGNNKVEAIIANRKESQGGFEIITFRRSIGRASVDVSTVN